MLQNGDHFAAHLMLTVSMKKCSNLVAYFFGPLCIIDTSYQPHQLSSNTPCTSVRLRHWSLLGDYRPWLLEYRRSISSS